ncbi:hypothetical protein LWC33_16190 [Pseudonocardia sp. RS11V-5]|uniref:hypothetical protein n=1 Tax=Pseudonocardia terrae TaxID=2905831 RepID=UPI001E5518D1|nr:hypothetical protein [Pseudonocardia terrae]MCE3552991.1 hypothetical protein [Pseudonocardia terrae]
MFIKLPEPLLQQWEQQVAESEVVVAHREAYRRYRTNRRSDRLKGTFKPLAGWPGARVPDSEGTLGGLVSLGEPRTFTRVFRRALADAHRCSSDPLCSERILTAPADFLHGAACHVCLFVSETTCERGNRFLDRRFVVPIDPAFPAVYPDAVR